MLDIRETTKSEIKKNYKPNNRQMVEFKLIMIKGEKKMTFYNAKATIQNEDLIL